MKMYNITKLILLISISFILNNQVVICQNNYPTSANSSVYIDGGSINMEKPITTGGWARGTYNAEGSNRLGGIGLFGSAATPKHYFMAHGSTPWNSKLGLYVIANGNVGVGTYTPKAKLQVGSQLLFNSPSLNGWGGMAKNMYWDGFNKRLVNDEAAEITFDHLGNILFRSAPAGAANTNIDNLIRTNMTIKNGGGIDVCGSLRATEVIVEDGWCDYVFEEDYILKTIEEEQMHIAENGYLSGFESEEKMAGEINVGDVTKRQQQKIEEQMLYIIQLNKENKELNTKYDEVLKIVTELQAQIQK